MGKAVVPGLASVFEIVVHVGGKLVRSRNLYIKTSLTLRVLCPKEKVADGGTCVVGPGKGCLRKIEPSHLTELQRGQDNGYLPLQTID